LVCRDLPASPSISRAAELPSRWPRSPSGMPELVWFHTQEDPLLAHRVISLPRSSSRFRSEADTMKPPCADCSGRNGRVKQGRVDGPQRLDILRIQHIAPGRHVVPAIRHRFYERPAIDGSGTTAAVGISQHNLHTRLRFARYELPQHMRAGRARDQYRRPRSKCAVQPNLHYSTARLQTTVLESLLDESEDAHR
jgi:hypothetical protein